LTVAALSYAGLGVRYSWFSVDDFHASFSGLNISIWTLLKSLSLSDTSLSLVVSTSRAVSELLSIFSGGTVLSRSDWAISFFFNSFDDGTVLSGAWYGAFLDLRVMLSSDTIFSLEVISRRTVSILRGSFSLVASLASTEVRTTRYLRMSNGLNTGLSLLSVSTRAVSVNNVLFSDFTFAGLLVLNNWSLLMWNDWSLLLNNWLLVGNWSWGIVMSMVGIVFAFKVSAIAIISIRVKRGLLGGHDRHFLGGHDRHFLVDNRSLL